METGTIETGVEDRIIKWSHDDGEWIINIVKDEENPDSDGHTELRKETILKTVSYTEE